MKITNINQISNYTTNQLVTFFNQLTGEQVKRFSTRPVGLKRIEAALELHAQHGRGNNEGLAEVEEEKAHVTAGVPDAKPAPAPKPARKTKAPVADADYNFPVGTVKKHREGTGRAKLIAVLLRGATVAECAEATGWSLSRVRVHIREVHNYTGYGLRTDATTGKITAFVG